MSHSHRLPSRRGRRSLTAVTAAVLVAAGAGTALAAGGGHHDPGNHTDHPGLHGSLRQLTGNPDCTLQVPASPLSAKGLATAYVLSSAGVTCNESDENTAAFVQATILDTDTGAISVYDPPVRNTGQPLLGTAPPVPKLPRHAVVAIWTGFNAGVLKLTGPGQGGFTNFAQQGFDNSPQFFASLRHAEHRRLVKVPALGTGKDGMTCPSSRDFSIVDQDQSDNVPVAYPAYGTGNGSDEALLDFVDTSLGCTSWTVPSLSSPGTMSADGLLQEEQASVDQAAPVALVPGLDPFVTSGGKPDLRLQNLYRMQVGQPPTWNDRDTPAYCTNLAGEGVTRLKADAPFEGGAAPQFAPGTSLAAVLQGRFAATWGNLACAGPDPYPAP